MDNNCRIRISKGAVTIEANIDGEWKDILLINSVGVKNTETQDIKEFALWVNKGLAEA